MKKIVMFAVAVMLLSACGGKGDGSTEKKGSDWSLDSITDSLSFKVGEQEILSQVDIVYPKNVESVKNDLMEFVKTLGQGDEFNGYPDSVKIDTTDMVSLVKYLVKSKAELLKADFVDGEPTEIPLDYELKVYVLEDTEQYLTLAVKEALLYGGPGPRITDYGITYLKSDGKKIGPDDLNVSKTEEIKSELLTKVETYIGDLIKGEDYKVDDVLYFKNGTNPEEKFDFPCNGFYIDGDSVVFPYQSEELTARSFGQPVIKFALKEMKDKEWLSKSLSNIVK